MGSRYSVIAISDGHEYQPLAVGRSPQRKHYICIYIWGVTNYVNIWLFSNV